jgi:hypothetical protein
VKLKNISWLKSTEINCIFIEYISCPIKAYRNDGCAKLNRRRMHRIREIEVNEKFTW